MRNVSVLCGVVLVLFTAGSAAGQGVNFSVKSGSQGLAGTGVAAQVLAEVPENDVFIGGGCINSVRLLQTKLGLLPGDDIDALCYQFAPFPVSFMGNMGEEAGWRTQDGAFIYWHFSVDPQALGRPGSFVNNEVTIGTAICGTQANPNEAHGDYFFTSIQFMSTNILGADEAQLGLAVPMMVFPHVNDDLNGLDLNATPIDRLNTDPPQFLQPGDLFFSLAAGSPSLALTGTTAEDILTPNGSGSFQVHMPAVFLGILPGSDLDGLFFDATGIPFFSVKNLVPAPFPTPDANPGDILVPDGMYLLPPDTVADELIPARNLGLLDLDIKTRLGTPRVPDIQDDNLDALDAELEPVMSPVEPPPIQDLALPVEIEGEGETPIEGEGEIPPEGEGEIPVEGEGEVPIEGEGEMPVEGEGETPVEGEGEVSVEGEGEIPVEGEGEGEMQHGPNITVAPVAIGLPPSAGVSPREINTEGTPWNDIYKAGGNAVSNSISFKRLPSQLLGLTPKDDIDAISYGDPAVALPPLDSAEPPYWLDGVPGGGWESDTGLLIFWHFSVDGWAKGKPKTSVNTEVTLGTQWLLVPPMPNEAHGDYFVTSTVLPVPGGGRGSNLLVADEENLTLAVQPSPLPTNLDDNLNGLDLIASPIDRLNPAPPDNLQPGDLYFSLAAGSPTLALVVDPVEGRSCHEADILTPDGNGSFRIARVADGLACDGTYKVLGIPDTNDLDALYTDATVKPGHIPCFSVRDIIYASVPGPTPNANPGDILVPDGMIYPLGAPVADGVADELIPARDFGLRDLEDPLVGIAQYLLANFATLDGDGSGGLSWAEVTGAIVITIQQFKQLDLNGDGELDETELQFWTNLDDDNLDALDAEMMIVEAQTPLKGIDEALAAPEGEGEGEGEIEGEGEMPVEGEGEVPIEGEGEVPTEGEGEVPIEGEGEVPIEGEGEVPIEGEGEVPIEGEGEVPIEGEGEVPIEGEGEVPIEGEGEVPIEGEGEVPVEGEGEVPVEGEGEVPIEGEGEVPVEGEGEVPIEGEGEVPIEGEGELPVEGEGEVIVEGEVPIEGEGEVPIEGEGEVPIEGEGEVSVEGEGEAPVEGEGEVPIEGEGETPIEGEGEAPVEGEGEVPIEGEGEVPIEGEGEVPIEGEGEVPAEGEGEVPIEGEGEVPIEGEGEVPIEGEGEVPAEGEGEVPTEGEGEVPTEGEGEVPTEGEGEVPTEGEGEVPTEGEGEVPTEGEGEAPAEGEGEVPVEGEVEGEVDGEQEGEAEGEGEGEEEACGCCGGCQENQKAGDVIKRYLGDWLLVGISLLTLLALAAQRS